MFGQSNASGLSIPEARSMADSLGSLFAQGKSTAALSTRTGNTIRTRDGRELFAVSCQDACFRQAEENAVNRANAAMNDALNQAMAELFNGVAYTPLLASNLSGLSTRNGHEIAARTVNDRPQNSNGTSAAIALIFTVIDRFRLDYLEKTRELANSIKGLSNLFDTFADEAMRGIVSGSLFTTDGKALSCTNGQEITAWRYYDAQQQKAAVETAANLYNTIDAHRRDHLAVVKALETAIATSGAFVS